MRVLIPAGADPDLATLYATPPRSPWLRVNMVSTVDGAATGADGHSGSINNAADKRVFDALRVMADAVVVGAGTARAEGYGPGATPIVVVSGRGEVPETLRGAPAGAVLLATCAGAPGLAAARAELGDEHVLVTGDGAVDLPGLVAALHDRGLRQLLGEGGPTLLGDLLAAGLVDELCATVVPSLVGGVHPRITTGPALDVPLTLHTLLEHDGTLLARWLVGRHV
ncbi:pyrimidine reductase family protein [Myroides odoratimimus subsp. xuanwuensis]